MIIYTIILDLGIWGLTSRTFGVLGLGEERRKGGKHCSGAFSGSKSQWKRGKGHKMGASSWCPEEEAAPTQLSLTSVDLCPGSWNSHNMKNGWFWLQEICQLQLIKALISKNSAFFLFTKLPRSTGSFHRSFNRRFWMPVFNISLIPVVVLNKRYFAVDTIIVK